MIVVSRVCELVHVRVYACVRAAVWRRARCCSPTFKLLAHLSVFLPLLFCAVVRSWGDASDDLGKLDVKGSAALVNIFFSKVGLSCFRFGAPDRSLHRCRPDAFIPTPDTSRHCRAV